MIERTWDGLPVSAERPHGASIVVWRTTEAGLEFLLLHRAHEGPDYAGDWAWNPPGGARVPGEPIDECARRELAEETGLTVEFRATACFDGDEWLVYEAEAPAEAEVVLSPEHDAYRWLPLQEAYELCLPRRVADQLACVARTLG